jgi:hypothetical protein
VAGRVEEAGAPVLDAVEGSGAGRESVRGRGLGERVAVHQNGAVKRFRVVHGVDVLAESYVVAAFV